VTTYLLDANVLIALVVPDHVHHARASAWLRLARRFAVCPIVEGALVRFLVRAGVAASSTSAGLRRIRDLPDCEFWPDALSYADADLSLVRGHRQVTDAYLVRLAQRHEDAMLATFDEALADLYPGLVVRVPDA